MFNNQCTFARNSDTMVTQIAVNNHGSLPGECSFGTEIAAIGAHLLYYAFFDSLTLAIIHCLLIELIFMCFVNAYI